MIKLSEVIWVDPSPVRVLFHETSGHGKEASWRARRGRTWVQVQTVQGAAQGERTPWCWASKPPELWGNKCPLFKSLILWYFVYGSPTNYYMDQTAVNILTTYTFLFFWWTYGCFLLSKYLRVSYVKLKKQKQKNCLPFLQCV